MGLPRFPEGSPVRIEELEGGAVWRVLLATPKANVLDAAKIRLLTDVFAAAGDDKGLKAVLLEGEGPNFSFGASVEEHLPGSFAEMLRGFHGLFHEMLDAAVPVVSAVRGRCLGGGMELAVFANRVFASPGAVFGQPEIVLGVFPPVASVFLTERIGRGLAEDICLGGRDLSGEEAAAHGLADACAEDPEAAALEWIRDRLLPKSAASLRMGVRALRAGMGARFRRDLAEAERLYVEELMKLEDPVEGLQAFLEKRKPEWRNA